MNRLTISYIPLVMASSAIATAVNAVDLGSGSGMCERDSLFSFEQVEWNYSSDTSLSTATMRLPSGMVYAGSVANVRAHGESKKVSLWFANVPDWGDRAEITIFKLEGSNLHRASVVHFVNIGGEFFVDVNMGFEDTVCISR